MGDNRDIWPNYSFESALYGWNEGFHYFERMAGMKVSIRFSQVLIGAVGAILRHNETEVKFHMEIDHQISVCFSLLVL